MFSRGISRGEGAKKETVSKNCVFLTKTGMSRSSTTCAAIPGTGRRSRRALVFGFLIKR
ncbi:hypothetical protein HMPREF7215_1600 [Pyramidobacter piscolens W5455]|uniref:Uncharacterized protein n=1 Tax=Pyramidobacter piscolens W5455 TaxID=352165 RepID=A0ABP2HRC9_9BACT|nr:hypothetical protein HMPREF7215_1600 [Pyramidobacter piscolens W5455]